MLIKVVDNLILLIKSGITNNEALIQSQKNIGNSDILPFADGVILIINNGYIV